MRALGFTLALLTLSTAAIGAQQTVDPGTAPAPRGAGAGQASGGARGPQAPRGAGAGQPPRAAAATPEQRETAVTPEQLKAAIDKLGTVDYAVRTAAARTIRRVPAPTAVPALLEAIAGHTDGYVRFRSLILLSGFNDPRTREVMAQQLNATNDRLRAVGFAYFEHNVDPLILPRLLEALTHEESEFVRPALTRALAAYASDAKVRDVLNGLVMKGEDFFRSGVIEALGDYKAAYALPVLTSVAKLDGPLQDDAVIALGKIGDKRSLETLAALQRTAPKNVQPAIAAAICLLGVNCASHQGYLAQSLRFAVATAGYQELLRASTAALAALAISGDAASAALLIEVGAPSRDPARAAIALALGAVALRNTPEMLKILEAQPDPKPGIVLVGEAFDMLEEDLDEERFFVTVRRGYWAAPEGSPARKIAAALIQTLEF
jgi:HEAT repeat protein